MAINLHQINEHEKKKAAQQAEVKPDMTQPMYDRRPLDVSVTQPFKDMKQLAEKPTLERYDVDELERNARSQYIQSFDNWADASKDGSFSQQEWASKQIEKAIAEGKNPGDYLYLTQLMGSAETPDEIKKREKREALGETFRNLGSLIGNVANLYYTNKGGQYIDLNTANEKHRERMQRLKDKQDALAEKRNNILINAKLGDLKAARAEKVAKDKAAKDAAEKQADRAWKAKYDAYMKELDNAYKLGQIDAQTKARLETLAVQAENAEKLEEVRQSNKIEVANINNEAAQKRAETRSGGSGSKESTLTYNGKTYKKNDLSAMIALYRQLKKDGYSVKEVKGEEGEKVDVKDYINAILGAGKADPVEFVKRAEIIDSDIKDTSVGSQTSGDKEQKADKGKKKGTSLLPNKKSNLLP